MVMLHCGFIKDISPVRDDHASQLTVLFHRIEVSVYGGSADRGVLCVKMLIDIFCCGMIQRDNCVSDQIFLNCVSHL